jgi:hypothetical protein
VIEGPGTFVGITRAPVDLVDDSPLRRLGNSRHGEIGVAAQVAQQGDFASYTAASAIWTRVIQRPIAMDEPENCAAILPAKQAVVIRETTAKFSDLFAEGIAAFAIESEVRFIVMDVHFDIADAETHQFRDAFDYFRLVAFLRVEKAVLGTLASSVSGGVLSDAR